MKSLTLEAFATVIGLALSTSAFAQGRHDEKPHAMPAKPSAAAADTDRTYAGSGHHDEKPHGMRKPTAKKDTTKAVDDKSGK